MHSMEEKFKLFMKIENEIYLIIEDALNLHIDIIIKMIKKHLKMYNQKYRLYNFIFKSISEENRYTFIYTLSYKGKDVYQDIIYLRRIIRNFKIDILLR